MTENQIAVALSGGVDSAVAAALLIDQGYSVFGVTMRLWQEPPETTTGSPVSTHDPVENAQRVAAALGIPLHVVDARDLFKQHVVDAFIKGYCLGLTPNPCLYCNRHLKFGYLLQHILELGAGRLATGHYVRTRLTQDGRTWQLLKGIDERKDQSYVLYRLEQEQLSRVLFPVGGMTKNEVRAIAVERCLPVSHTEESQDLCFVLDNDYRRFLRRHAPQAFTPGPILDHTGKEIGRHQGLAAYTIGQRRGISIPAPEALYVLHMDIAQNALIVAPQRELGQDHLVAHDVRWVSGRPPEGPIEVTAKIRYKSRPALATVTHLSESHAEVRFAEPLRDITPGQGVVFYDDQVVLGGGLIAR